ncbi:27553_t:CDS:2, partial [Racocetra persica]
IKKRSSDNYLKHGSFCFIRAYKHIWENGKEEWNAYEMMWIVFVYSNTSQYANARETTKLSINHHLESMVGKMESNVLIVNDVDLEKFFEKYRDEFENEFDEIIDLRPTSQLTKTIPEAKVNVVFNKSSRIYDGTGFNLTA